MCKEGDYTAVKEYIDEHILCQKKAVSMGILHSIYGLQPGDPRYRSKLKSRLKKDYSSKLAFLSGRINMPAIVVDATIPASDLEFDNKEACIMKAAEYLREDILEQSENFPELTWPPDIDELQKERSPPSSLMDFFKFLLRSRGEKRNRNTEYCERLAKSYASDVIGAVTRGKTITAKQFLLALGLHNITGQRNVVEIVSRLGHCLNYTTTCEIETALAAKAQALSLSDTLLPLRPSSPDKYVLTVFWVDNFDVKIERQTGATSLHTTHMVAFQEKCSNSLTGIVKVNMEKTRKRKLQPTDVGHQEMLSEFVNPKTEPPIFTSENVIDEESISPVMMKHFLWLWIRKQNSIDQQFATFSGEFSFITFITIAILIKIFTLQCVSKLVPLLRSVISSNL